VSGEEIAFSKYRIGSRKAGVYGSKIVISGNLLGAVFTPRFCAQYEARGPIRLGRWTAEAAVPAVCRKECLPLRNALLLGCGPIRLGRRTAEGDCPYVCTVDFCSGYPNLQNIHEGGIA
jgi:hypothetical protein